MNNNLLLSVVFLVSILVLTVLIILLVRKVKQQKNEISILSGKLSIAVLLLNLFEDMEEFKDEIDEFMKKEEEKEDKEIAKNDGVDKEFISKHKKGVAKKIAQYSEFGEFIKNFKSIRQAEKETGIGRALITKSCNENVAVKGFKFKFIYQ